MWEISCGWVAIASFLGSWVVLRGVVLNGRVSDWPGSPARNASEVIFHLAPVSRHADIPSLPTLGGVRVSANNGAGWAPPVRSAFGCRAMPFHTIRRYSTKMVLVPATFLFFFFTIPLLFFFLALWRPAVREMILNDTTPYFKKEKKIES